jgi:signal transduction histidine kinase
LKFTPASGRVTLETHTDDATAVLAVTDTGIGIPSDEMSLVFERFWRGGRARTAAGSGIGLTVVAQLVRAHGGVVAVESEPGRGTRIEARLPTAE